MELCIDTSTHSAGIALTENDRIIKAVYWHSSGSHTLELASAVAQMLEMEEKVVNDIGIIIKMCIYIF